MTRQLRALLKTLRGRTFISPLALYLLLRSGWLEVFSLETKSRAKAEEMFSRREIFILLLIASLTCARPGDNSDVGPDFTLDGEVVASVESRFSFPDDDVEVEDVKLEDGNFFQGDIKLLAEQKEILDRLAVDKNSFPTRTGILNEEYRWPKDNEGYVNIPYEFAPGSKYCKMSRILIPQHQTSFFFQH
jgi:hypothetical protein